MLFSQKEKEKQQSSIVALQAKPQESANLWSKYGSLVEKDNIADEDGVITEGSVSGIASGTGL